MGFSTDFLYFTFFDGYVAVDDLTFEVGFGIGEDRINDHFYSQLGIADGFLIKVYLQYPL